MAYSHDQSSHFSAAVRVLVLEVYYGRMNMLLRLLTDAGLGPEQWPLTA